MDTTELQAGERPQAMAAYFMPWSGAISGMSAIATLDLKNVGKGTHGIALLYNFTYMCLHFSYFPQSVAAINPLYHKAAST